MTVYVFGNIDRPEDNQAILAAKKLKNKNPQINFVFINPNEDVPFAGDDRVVILDVAAGIEQVELITGADLDKLLLSPRGSVHDFDLAFQLRYLKKLGKIGQIVIIAIPQQKKIDYLRIQSILRKLVAQDMQGS